MSLRFSYNNFSFYFISLSIFYNFSFSILILEAYIAPVSYNLQILLLIMAVVEFMFWI
jgi:hypothetical protein